jgi:hypothetical protein
MMEFGAGVIGLAFAIVTVIWSRSALANDRNEVFKQLDDLDMRFKNELTTRQEQLRVVIDVPRLTVRLGDTWRKKVYSYSVRDTYGPFVLSYLKWRYDNPQIMGPDMAQTCLQIAALYRRLLLPGPCVPQDQQIQAWSVEQYQIGKEMGIILVNNDIHSYLSIYTDMQSYLIKKNVDEFNVEIRKLTKLHTMKQIKKVEPPLVQQDIAWSDAVGFFMATKNLSTPDAFEFCSSESEAIDSISSMMMNRHVIDDHMRAVRGFIADVVPLYFPDAKKAMFTNIAPSTPHRTQ